MCVFVSEVSDLQRGVSPQKYVVRFDFLSRDDVLIAVCGKIVVKTYCNVRNKAVDSLKGVKKPAFLFHSKKTGGE